MRKESMPDIQFWMYPSEQLRFISGNDLIEEGTR